MTLQSDDRLAITRPAVPETGTYQLSVSALAELLSPLPVVGISGILWSTTRSAADNTWQAVCWSAERRLYVAVGNSGSGNRVMTSPGWDLLDAPPDTGRQPGSRAGGTQRHRHRPGGPR